MLDKAKKGGDQSNDQKKIESDGDGPGSRDHVDDGADFSGFGPASIVRRLLVSGKARRYLVQSIAQNGR